MDVRSGGGELPEKLPENLLEQLKEQHRQTELRVRDLDRHVWLSPDEQAELTRLKKEKLHIKDRMRSLAARS